MKKTIIFFIFIILVGYGIYNISQFTVENNKSSIQTNVKMFINRGEVRKLNPHIIDIEQIGESNSFIALFQLNNSSMGFAHLEKGLNNKMKILTTTYGDDNKVSYSDIKTNNGKYIAIIGINKGLNIDHITTKLMYEKYTYNVNVSNEEYFIKYKKLPRKLKDTFPADLILYDKKGNVLP
ncbi:hypothetical protein [Gottfriedia solisilvae]|uniref:Uncharacterized protein n=1 Tax=Gottfriedia solisilvae TaxID=1516104 RepID=A0A8J3AN54_9BACI|nr:hypothetical protein [Gottfriedia solisilvae]GGI17787.1 hypothetical protein GCM10007380_39680 [Gottfriedia solisilvae]